MLSVNPFHHHNGVYQFMQLLKYRVLFIIQCIFNINGAAQFYGFGGKSELQPVSEPRSASGILETELSIIHPQKLFKNKHSRAISSKHIPLRGRSYIT